MVHSQHQKRSRKVTAPSSQGPVAPQRPVRFVTNNDEPLSKRRRISAACRTCQRRKTKCSGEKPDCSTCLESDAVCLGYVQHSQHSKKGSKTAKPQKVENDYHEESESRPRAPSELPDNLGTNRILDANSLEGAPISVNLKSAAVDSVTSVIDSRGEHLEAGDNSLLDDHPEFPTHYRNRVPYFRYFGPTAMVPGFKQMVVDLNHHPELKHLNGAFAIPEDLEKKADRSEASHQQSSSPPPPTIPFYTRNDRLPVQPLIRELCNDFFTHLGGNYPFLTRKTFMQDLEKKAVETILVDAICAIAARFSKNPALVKAGQAAKCDAKCADRAHKSKYGSIFARRAMSAVTDHFARPTLASVQACLLLAYEQFGADHDSGLWMYLGLSIRMAQDLGIQKLEGLEYEGYLGPTPKTAKSGFAGQAEEKRRAEKYYAMQAQLPADGKRAEIQRLGEKERINTFWAIFFLDRVVSSGTGRPVTLRDKDIEISFPRQDETDGSNEWPAPFPALIRIVHSYGRVANLLNNIREVNQLTPETMKQLVAAEDDLIGIYQRLSPKLHFSAANFQHYLKHSQATNFILLHFWFHTLIVLLHQPTLLHSFEGRIQQLFPNSQELSLSSAKTIADILSFAELLDSKSFIGNPFTSQPMYFAACAFLLESVSHASSLPQSRLGTPPMTPLLPTLGTDPKLSSVMVDGPSAPTIRIQRPGNRQAQAKRSLLAAAASQNYQRCYKALKTLETYWAGTRYIVTVLDQKAKGSLDPLLYTAEYLGTSDPRISDSVLEAKHEKSNGAQEELPRNLSSHDHQIHLDKLKFAVGPHFGSSSGGKGNEPTSQAIGWSLAGSSDSAGSNLSVLYQAAARDDGTRSQLTSPHNFSSISGYQVTGHKEFGAGQVHPAVNVMPQNPSDTNMGDGVSLFDSQNLSPDAVNHASPEKRITALNSSLPDYDSAGTVLLSTFNPPTMPSHPSGSDSDLQSVQAVIGESTPYTTADSMMNPYPEDTVHQSPSVSSQIYGLGSQANNNFNDMIIESKDIDTSALGLDPLLWMEFVPQNILESFDLQNDIAAETRGIDN